MFVADKVPALVRQDWELAHAYERSLLQAVKSEVMLVAARGEVRSKILGCEVLIQSAALIVSGSFVSATLHNINIFAIIV